MQQLEKHSSLVHGLFLFLCYNQWWMLSGIHQIKEWLVHKLVINVTDLSDNLHYSYLR